MQAEQRFAEEFKTVTNSFGCDCNLISSQQGAGTGEVILHGIYHIVLSVLSYELWNSFFFFYLSILLEDKQRPVNVNTIKPLCRVGVHLLLLCSMCVNVDKRNSSAKWDKLARL